MDAFPEPVFNLSLGREVSSHYEASRVAASLNLVERNPPADTPARLRDIRDRQMAKRERYAHA